MKKIFASIIIASFLAACGPSPSYVPPVDNNGIPAAPAPVAQQEGYGGGTVAAAAIGGAVLGHMMGKSSANNQPRTVIVDRRPLGYGYNDYRSRKTVTTTVTKRSMFGGKTVTRTTTRRR